MTKALVMTDKMPMPSRMPYQIPSTKAYKYYIPQKQKAGYFNDFSCVEKLMFNSPISLAWEGRGRRHWVTNLYASKRISMTLFSSAKRGARGKAATKMVVKPNCRTVKKNIKTQAIRSHSCCKGLSWVTC